MYNVKIGEQAFDNCSNLNIVNLCGKVELLFSYYTSPFDLEKSDLEIRIFETAANVMDYEAVLDLLACADHCKITYMKTGDDLAEIWDMIEDAWADDYNSLADIIKIIGKEIDAEKDFGYLEDIVLDYNDEE